MILGRIKNGIVEISKVFKDEVVKAEGKTVEISVVGRNRTDNQNAYMWAVVYKLISDHTGYSTEEVHQVFKDKFLTYRKNGHKFVKSTTELNTKEFGDYLNKVIAYAQGELEIIIPDADIIG